MNKLLKLRPSPRSAAFCMALAVLSLFALPVHAVYKCVDDKGVTHYGDTMPPQCANKAITEMSAKGNIIKRIEAPLTPEQQKVRNAEIAQRKLVEKQIAELTRTDNALIGSYTEEKEFDITLERALGQLSIREEGLKQMAENNIKALARVNKQIEFFRSGQSKANKGSKEPPAQLLTSLARTLVERDNIQAQLANVGSERVETKQKYQTYKQRWKMLKRGMPIGTIISADTPQDSLSDIAPASKPGDVAVKAAQPSSPPAVRK